MELNQNRFVRGAARADFRQYGREVFLPEDMPEEEVQKLLSDALKAGIIKKVTKLPVEKGAGSGEVPGTPGRSPTKAGEVESYPAPSSVQVYVSSVGAATPGNGVSSARSGPCMIEHIELFTYADGGALNVPQVFSVHVSRSPDVGPYGGEICVFEYNDPQDLLGIGEGAGVVFYKQRVDTAVGSRAYPVVSFFPRILIPFPTFFVNCTARPINHPAACFITVDFGPAVVPAAMSGRTVSVVPRVTSTARPAAAAKPVAAPKAISTRTFKSYVQMKEFEALGNGIVWASVRNTGDPQNPISASVVVGGTSKGGYLAPSAPTILAGGELRELPGIIRP